MKHRSIKKRLLSVFLAVLMAVGTLTPALTALAGDVIDKYVVELFYEDGTIVPDTDEEGNEFKQYMKEGEELQLSYQFIDCELPDNGYVKWYSETPTLVDVNDEGLVKAFDSSKGAVIQSWIDNEVKTIPLVGSLLGTAFEKLLFNDTINVDTMDTEEIIAVIEAGFGSDSPLAKYFESYKGQLVDSLREYLDNINSNIHITMYDADGTVLADDYVSITVQKSDEIYADFLPNGTHITNKSNIETTVAKGSTCQLYAVTTPVRLHMGVVYSVKSSSIFTQGNVVATVDDSGLVTFKNTGTVTIIVSPDTKGFVDNLLKFVNYIYELDNTGTIDTGKVADILIKYVGIDMDRNVLAAILDVCFAVKDIVGDTADPIQLTATAATIIANIVMQFVYNDKITFTVVDGVPCTDFTIEGPDTVEEGTQIQLGITDAKPVAADTSDITWSSSDESVAYVDPKTGIVTGRDAGGSLGSLSQKTAVITATSAANNVQKSITITVTGRTGRYLSDAVISGKDYMNIGEEQDLSYTVYPSRVATADNLYITWGVVTGGTDEETYEYAWAQEPYDETVTDEATGEETVVHHDGTASDGIGKIDAKGHYTAVAGGTAKIAMKAVTGYYILNDKFYEISSVIAYMDIANGLPVSDINVSAADKIDGGTLSTTLTTKEVEINGETHYFATVKKPVGAVADGSGIKALATVLPEDATNKKVTWYVSNDDFELKNQDNSANTIDVKIKAAVEKTSSTELWCVSEDGEITSEKLTLCVTRNYATSNNIDQESISVTNGKTADATHTMTFADSFWSSDMYVCKDCSWYSSDEDIFTVENKGNDNSDAVITGVDVGTATLYCVSADGGILDTAEVTVYPDKEYLQEVVTLCENSVITRTDENKDLYKEFSKNLDYAYYVLYDEPLASQSTCDTYARKLLYSFYQLGGYVGLNGVSIVNKDGSDPGDFISCHVSTSTRYDRSSIDLDAAMNPEKAMYRSIQWTPSSDSISVDKNGICKPTSNSASWAVITVTAEDYMGTTHSDSVVVAFANYNVTGISLDTTSIQGGKVGETRTLKATLSPTGTLGVGKASIQDVVWTSSDEKVAAVDQSGKVTFNYGGDCVITATSCDGGYQATCTVNVVTNYDALQGQITTYKQLNLISTNYYPDTWEAFQKAIADSEALIAAQNSTQPEVDAMLEKLIAAYEGLEKYNLVNNIEIYLDGEAASEYYQYDLSLLSEGISYKNAKLDLNVRLYPNNANYATVEWISSTEDIVISEDGVASPASNKSCYGQITCIVTDHFGNQWKDQVWVSFAYYVVTGVKLSEQSISGAIGNTYQLTATIEPTGTLGIGKASIQDLLWVSSDENVATVDQNGLVTFTGTGATTVKAISYDGGFYGECSVSTSGDRNALKAAIEKYKDVDYRDYEYVYGMAFKTAYEEAVATMDDISKNQEAIDSAADKLNSAGEALAGHELVKVETIVVNWEGYKISSLKGRGTVSTETNALSIDMDAGGYGLLHYANSVVLNAAVYPGGADSTSITWSVDDTHSMKGEADGAKLTLTPSTTAGDSWAIVTATSTDSYGRTTTRTITVVMSWHTVTGVTLNTTSLNMKATDSPVTLGYSLSTTGDTDFTSVTWSSSDPAIVSVDSNGAVTPVDIGTATVTVRTFDGGHTASCTVTVTADYSVLEAKFAQYNTLIEEVQDNYVYTEESLAVLQAEVAKAKKMIDDYRSTQDEINAQVEALDNAYNSLVRYIIADGVSITTDTNAQNNVTEENPGYFRYTHSTTINGKTIQLAAKTSPEGGLYQSIEWSSSNSKITVDANGLCTNTSITPSYSVITCKITTVKGDTYSSTAYVSFARYGVTGVSFDSEEVHGSPGTSVKIEPNIQSDALIGSLAISDCTFSSDNEAVATVDESGNVTFVSKGTATITATSCDGGYTATIKAYTTSDFSALEAAISDAEKLNYTDYAYDYGMAFKEAYDAAVKVNETYTAEQSEIDAACANLTTTMEALQGHEFVQPGEISIICGEETVSDGSALVVDENSSVTLSAQYAEGAMIKSAEWSSSAAVNVTAQADENGKYVITKTSADAAGSLAVMITLTDDYGRTYTKTVVIKIVNQKVNISEIAFTYNGEEVTEVNYDCNGIYTGKSIQLGINTYPAEADKYTSIQWTSTSSNLRVDPNTGVVSASGFMLQSSYTTTITCTVTLEDGSTVSNSIQVTFSR